MPATPLLCQLCLLSTPSSASHKSLQHATSCLRLCCRPWCHNRTLGYKGRKREQKRERGLAVFFWKKRGKKEWWVGLVHRLFLSCDERGKIGVASVEEKRELIRGRKGQSRERKWGRKSDFEWCSPRAFFGVSLLYDHPWHWHLFVKVLYFCNNGLMFP